MISLHQKLFIAQVYHCTLLSNGPQLNTKSNTKEIIKKKNHELFWIQSFEGRCMKVNTVQSAFSFQGIKTYIIMMMPPS